MRLRFWVVAGCALLAAAGCGGGGSIAPGAVPAPASPHSGPPPTTLPQHFIVTDLGANVQPTHINDSGAVVGSLGTTAFLWQAGSLTQFAPLSGYDSAVASWINNNGEIVGTSYTRASDNMDRATRFVPGSTAVDLGAPPGGDDTAAYAVNDNGTIVGGAAPLQSMGVRWSGITTFDGRGNATVLSGNDGGEAYAINNAGEYVGACMCYGDFPGTNTMAFKAVPFSTLPTPGTSNLASGINNNGDIIGYFNGGSDSGAIADGWILYNNGTVKELDAPGIATGPGSLQAMALNDNDWVVGTYSDQYFTGTHAFVYLDRMVDLNTLLPANSGWTLTNGTSVNVWGQIVGVGTLNGASHGFLLTPAP